MQFITAHLTVILLMLGSLIAGFFVAAAGRNSLRKTGTWIADEVMNKPHVNSRLVFFMHGLATAIGIFVLAVSFPFVHDRSGYPTMVATLGGGGVGAALGRWFTKKGDAENTAASAKAAQPAAPQG